MAPGMPLYIAPERFRPNKPDARCDIYSLGVILYRILVGQPPRVVAGITFKEFRLRIKDFPIIPPRQRDPKLPRALEAIVLKALAEDPVERYQTVAELTAALEQYLDITSGCIFCSYCHSWYRTVIFAQRHRTAFLVLALLLVTTVFALATHGLVTHFFKMVRAEREAVPAAVDESPRRRLQYFHVSGERIGAKKGWAGLEKVKEQ